LQDLRPLHVLELIRNHPKMIEADPNGAPILRSELLVFSPSDAFLEKARAAGFSVLRERTLEGLDARIVVLKAPDGTSTRRALKELKALDPAGAYDFNHMYTDSGQIYYSSVADQTAVADGAPAQQPDGGASARLGLIDGGVDTAHPVFRDIVVHQHGCAGTQVPAAHGTAVASLMVGRSARFRGASPGSELYAADVYCGLPTGGAADAVADALAWLVRERVAVINVSLVGPPNVMLENIVRMVIARGHVVVAAVGNDGPAAPPLYPASYPDVVGVTAVDARQRALIEAGRGRQVKFAAPGADMAAANPSQRYSMVRGTSFASPIVAGLLAGQMHEPDKAAAAQAVADLARRAIDLGAPGPDPIYGFGLVGGDLRPEAALVGNLPD
jgi:subtilisin family serine protease